MNSSKTAIMTREIVITGMMAAMSFAVATLIHVPLGTMGVVHAGDSIVFLSALLFGSRIGMFSSAVGMCLFDLASGYGVWAPFTFVIKAIMALITAKIAYSGSSKGDNSIKNIIGMVLAGIWMLGGYYVAEAIITKNIYTPAASLLGNTLQFGTGAVIAFILAAAIKKTKVLDNINF